MTGPHSSMHRPPRRFFGVYHYFGIPRAFCLYQSYSLLSIYTYATLLAVSFHGVYLPFLLHGTMAHRDHAAQRPCSILARAMMAVTTYLKFVLFLVVLLIVLGLVAWILVSPQSLLAPLVECSMLRSVFQVD
ncbi:uncharacterized protein EV420DRAFT_971758 [Desarmillaria tabescens]|uniref:Uncharacterized protein n=1 Tax=Armillaria tabescens TaxID=1929756 RepID=A0AA39JPW4_ARMTA|nr:uncharacterized protein EV420DRAFT_971758 [Desarmillaria tabescens]KAK0445314.1 hypothetical protein EV420DRAFT_971758 [Desarmillaria tabescens]